MNDADTVMAMVAMDLHPIEPVDHENTMIPGELIRYLGEVTRPTTPTMQQNHRGRSLTDIDDVQVNPA